MADEPADKPAETNLQEADNVLAEAKAVRDELKTYIAEKKALIEREERLKAADMLKGKSEEGMPPRQALDETPKEYAARIMSGRMTR